MQELHVIGQRPKDATYKAMIAAYKAITALELEVPLEIADFFRGSNPLTDEFAGLCFRLKTESTVSSDGATQVTIELDELPKGVTSVMVCNENWAFQSLGREANRVFCDPIYISSLNSRV